MRFVRLIAGILLLTIGLPMLLIGGALWTVSQQRSPNGGFGGPLDRVDTPGHAVVVPDLDALLREDAPLLRTSRTGMRIIARNGSDPAFIGLAPAAEVSNYLSATSFARIDRVSLTRGPLPLRVTPADRPGTETALGLPGEQSLWVRHGVGVLDLSPDDVRGHRLSLVVMRPDARSGVNAALRVEVRPGWLSPAAWSLLVTGGILALLGVALLARPVRPREVIFVVEPDQVPAFAARLGIAALNEIGPSSDRPDQSACVPAAAALSRPATLADVLPRPPTSPAVAAPAADSADRLVWPPLNSPARSSVSRASASRASEVRAARAPAPAPAPAPMPTPPPTPVPAPVPAPPLPAPPLPKPGKPMPVPAVLPAPAAPAVPAASTAPSSPAGSAAPSSPAGSAAPSSPAGSASGSSGSRSVPATGTPVPVAGPSGSVLAVPAAGPSGPVSGAAVPIVEPPVSGAAVPFSEPSVSGAAVPAAGPSGPVSGAAVPVAGPVPGAAVPVTGPSGSVPAPLGGVGADPAAVVAETGGARRLSLRPASPGAAFYDVGQPRTARSGLNRPKGYEPATRSAGMDASSGRRIGNAVPESETEQERRRNRV